MTKWKGINPRKKRRHLGVYHYTEGINKDKEYEVYSCINENVGCEEIDCPRVINKAFSFRRKIYTEGCVGKKDCDWTEAEWLKAKEFRNEHKEMSETEARQLLLSKKDVFGNSGHHT